LNGLTLTDSNVERRRYGRWGAPGNEAAPAKPKPGTDIVMPPAPLPPEVQEQTVPVVKEEPLVVPPVPVPPVPVPPVPAPPVPVPPVVAEPVKVETIETETEVVTPPAEPVVDPPKAPAPEDK
jgi:hypothetical protein